MSNRRLIFRSAATVAMFLVAGFAAPVPAVAADYSFEVAGPPVRTSAGWVTTVRLVGPSGQPISNADMSYVDLTQPNPKAMSSIQRRIPLASDGQGDYRLVTREPLRSGVIRLRATVPGEARTLTAQVPPRRDE